MATTPPVERHVPSGSVPSNKARTKQKTRTKKKKKKKKEKKKIK